MKRATKSEAYFHNVLVNVGLEMFDPDTDEWIAVPNDACVMWFGSAASDLSKGKVKAGKCFGLKLAWYFCILLNVSFIFAELLRQTHFSQMLPKRSICGGEGSYKLWINMAHIIPKPLEKTRLWYK